MRGAAKAQTVDEGGFAMVSVILFGVVLSALALMAVSQADRALSASDGHVQFEREIHLAETGVEQSLGRLQRDPFWDSGHVAVGTTPAQHDAWAAGALASAPVVAVDDGEYAVVKPDGLQVIYVAGWSPSRASARRQRMLKVEYLFSTYSPANAVLTNGALGIGGNASVTGSLGNVHANGNVDVVGNALTVSGTLTATGTITGGQPGWSGGQAPQEVPAIDPRSIYDRYAATPGYTENWYDLCSDGSVRQPSTGGPCTGTLLASTGGIRGWTFQNAIWKNDRDPYDGVYYVHEASAHVRGTDRPWRATILAAASGTTGALAHGDIEMTGNPRIAPFLPDVALVSGRDLDIQGTGTGDGSYEGLLGSHEQIKVTGNPTLFGALVSEDAVHTPGSPVASNYVSGSMVISHDRAMEAELGGLIRTTLWLELHS